MYFNKYVRGKVCAAGTNKWRDLGIVLMEQDDIDVLDIIKANSTDNVECCTRMFTEWRQRTPKASWKQLIEALKEVKLTQLASELEELLITSEECCVEQESKISQQQQLSLQELEGITILLVSVAQVFLKGSVCCFLSCLNSIENDEVLQQSLFNH